MDARGTEYIIVTFMRLLWIFIDVVGIFYGVALYKLAQIAVASTLQDDNDPVEIRTAEMFQREEIVLTAVRLALVLVGVVQLTSGEPRSSLDSVRGMGVGAGLLAVSTLLAVNAITNYLTRRDIYSRIDAAHAKRMDEKKGSNNAR